MYFRPPGVAVEDYVGGVTDITLSRLNRLHGYEAFRDPNPPGAIKNLKYTDLSKVTGSTPIPPPDNLADFLGSMPFNMQTLTPGNPAAPPYIIPTFDSYVNSSLINDGSQFAYNPAQLPTPTTSRRPSRRCTRACIRAAAWA